jgi:hypothetical protein
MRLTVPELRSSIKTNENRVGTEEKESTLLYVTYNVSSTTAVGNREIRQSETDTNNVNPVMKEKRIESTADMRAV